MTSRLLIFGGTGSLGHTLLRHLMDDYEQISVFSRDEAKHVKVKQKYPEVETIIGDIRDRDAVTAAILKTQPGVIINAAALKNVPEVEEIPMEAIKTSILGAENIFYATRGLLGYGHGEPLQPLKVLTISTDKACKPVNSYGMAKALQERLTSRANQPGMICNTVRYGNVLESRGSLIPIIKERIAAGKPIYITDPNMTRFFMTLDQSVELIKTALEDCEGGKIFIPRIRSAKIKDVIELFTDDYDKSRIRPGEKMDEILIAKEETGRTEYIEDKFFERETYVIHDILTEKTFTHIAQEYSSGSSNILMTPAELRTFLEETGVI